MGGIPVIEMENPRCPFNGKSKIFKNLEDGPQGFPARVFSQIVIFEIMHFPRIIFRKDFLLDFLVGFEILLQSQSEKQGFLMVGDESNNPENYGNIGSGGFYPSQLDLTSAP